jgi:hypothetical protein
MARGRKGHKRKGGSTKKPYNLTVAGKMGISKEVKEAMDRTARRDGVQPVYIVAHRASLAADYFKKRAKKEGFSPAKGEEPWEHTPVHSNDPTWPGSSRK